MTKFLQIRDRAYNVDHIVQVVFFDVNGKTRVRIDLHGMSEPVALTGDDAQAFMAWWDNKADVCVAG